MRHLLGLFLSFKLFILWNKKLRFVSLCRQVSTVCPNITTLNLITEDGALEVFHHLAHLKVVSLELEDCFGSGLFNFMEKFGTQLEQLSISCSSGNDVRHVNN